MPHIAPGSQVGTTGDIEQFTPPLQFQRHAIFIEIVFLDTPLRVTISTGLQFLHFEFGKGLQFR